MAQVPLTFRPGVNTQASQFLNEGGFSQSDLIRYKDGFLEKLGGWQRISNDQLVGICRGMQAFADLDGNKFLGCGTSERLEIWYNGVIYDVTPQRLVSPSLTTPFDVVSGSPGIKVHDSGSNAVVGDWVYIGSSVAIGGGIIHGFYKVLSVIDANTYNIANTVNFTSTDTGGGVLPNYATTMTSSIITTTLTNHGLVPDNDFLVYVSTTVGGVTLQGTYPVITTPTANTFTFDSLQIAGSSANAFENGGDVEIQYLFPSENNTSIRQWAMDTWGSFLICCYTAGPLIVWMPTVPPSPLHPAVPVADNVASAAVVAPGTGYAPADFITLAGGTFYDPAVLEVTDTKVVSATVTAGGASGTPGTQTVTGTTGTGTKFQASVTVSGGGSITAVLSITVPGDYTVNPTVITAEPVTGAGLVGATLHVIMGVLDVIVTDPGSYQATPSQPVSQASTTGVGTGATFDISVNEAPSQFLWMFVAMPERQVIGLGCTDPNTGLLDPLLVRFSDIENYDVWTPTATNQAGSYRVPSGSTLVGGIQGPQFGYFWTDIEMWAMQYINFPFVYSFTKIGLACGLLASRAVVKAGGVIYWMGRKEFFLYDGNEVRTLPCAVWDFVFNNLDWNNLPKITAAANTEFTEVAWYFPVYPSLTGIVYPAPGAYGAGHYGAGPFGFGDGTFSNPGNEPAAYVKYNIRDNIWDYGYLDRSAWTDQSILGDPIGADADGYLQQHETSPNADGLALMPTATTGYMAVGEGAQYAFVERIIPDFILSDGATVQVMVNAVNYTLDEPKVFGPYNVTQGTRWFIVRARARYISLTVQSQDMNSTWRLGKPTAVIIPAGDR